MSKTIQFEPARSLAKLVVIVMCVMIAFTISSLVTDVVMIDLLTSINDSEASATISDEYIDSVDFWYNAFGLLQLFWFPTLAIFLIWFHRVYRNLQFLGGTELGFNPKWVVAYFFIPILALWKPLRATEEIWKVSDSTVITSNRASREGIKLSAFVTTWWIFWVISNIIGWFSFRYSMALEDSIEGYIGLSGADFVSGIFGIISLMLTIPLVREISRRQTRKALIMSTIPASGLDSGSGDDKTGEDQGFQGLKP